MSHHLSAINGMVLCLALLLSLASCSYFIAAIEQPNHQLNDLKFIKKQSYCPNTSLQITTESPSISSKYQKLSAAAPRPLIAAEKFVLLALLQMYSFPHVASPSANLIFFSRQKKKWQYLLFSPDSVKSKFPLLSGLTFILKQHRSRYRLEQLAALIDRHPNSSPTLSDNTIRWIHSLPEQANTATDAPEFQQFYHRNNQPLGPQVSLQFNSLARWIKRQNPTPPPPQTIRGQLHPLPLNSSQKLTAKCNFDATLYPQSIFPVLSQPLPSVQFSLKHRKQLFMGVISQFPQQQLIAQTPFFHRQPLKAIPGLCALWHNNWPQIIMLSGDSRDPTQHLYHLLTHQLRPLSAPQHLDSLLKSPRMLLLYNPPRLLHEFERTAQSQWQKIQRLNIPIYRTLKLGKITAAGDFAGQTHLFADHRHPMNLVCQ